MMNFIAGMVGNLFRPPRTEPLSDNAPPTPIAYRGRVAVDESKCVGCSTCAQVCACQAIRLNEEDEGIRLTVWHSHCSFCGLCEFYCPTDAIYLTNDWDLSHASGDTYAMQESVLARYQICEDCGAKLMVPQTGIVQAANIGRIRGDGQDNPKCDSCRRKERAAQIIGVKI